MKIVYVAGGNYKSFYINCFLHLFKCDLLIFNFGILYDYYVEKEKDCIGVVSNELFTISNKLNCCILAGVFCIDKHNIKTRAMLICDGKKIDLRPAYQGVKLKVADKTFKAGESETNFGTYNKIIFTNYKLKPDVLKCNKRRFYLFCDNYGVSYVAHKNLKRKFNKYSKIILK